MWSIGGNQQYSYPISILVRHSIEIHLQCAKFYGKYVLIREVFPNVINSILEPISFCPIEQNISVSAYFDVPFQGISPKNIIVLPYSIISPKKKKKRVRNI